MCNGLLRRIAVVETKADILSVLTPLGLARPYERPFALGPPRPEVAVLVDAASGELHVLDPPGWRPGLPYPKPRDGAIRFRAEVMEPGEEFDQTGFELPPVPGTRGSTDGQQELFSDELVAAGCRRRRTGVLARQHRPKPPGGKLPPARRAGVNSSLAD